MREGQKASGRPVDDTVIKIARNISHSFNRIMRESVLRRIPLNDCTVMDMSRVTDSLLGGKKQTNQSKTSSNNSTLNPQLYAIGHFRVAVNLTMKARLSAKLFI